MLILIILVLLQFSPVRANENIPRCASFQAFTYPKLYLNHQTCQEYNNSTCCDSNSAKYAYQWALNNNECTSLNSTDSYFKARLALACHIYCSPNLILLNNKPVICQDWFTENIHGEYSSAIYSYYSDPNLHSCTFLSDLTIVEIANKIFKVELSQTNCTSPTNLVLKQFNFQIIYIAILVICILSYIMLH